MGEHARENETRYNRVNKGEDKKKRANNKRAKKSLFNPRLFNAVPSTVSHLTILNRS